MQVIYKCQNCKGRMVYGMPQLTWIVKYSAKGFTWKQAIRNENRERRKMEESSSKYKNC